MVGEGCVVGGEEWYGGRGMCWRVLSLNWVDRKCLMESVHWLCPWAGGTISRGICILKMYRDLTVVPPGVIANYLCRVVGFTILFLYTKLMFLSANIS